jgi:sulfite oxidase
MFTLSRSAAHRVIVKSRSGLNGPMVCRTLTSSMALSQSHQQQQHWSSSSSSASSSSWARWMLYAGLGALAGTALTSSSSSASCAGADVNIAKPLVDDSELPLMTLTEMQKLREDGHVVVSFQGIVYDVSDFTGHPGGYGRLEMASGHDLEPFWRVYTQHNRGHIVEEILVRYRIGRLSPKEAEEIRNATTFENPYSNDPGPETYPELLTNTRHPYNAEGRLRDLRKSWVTPIGRHFVRNHSTVPDIKPEEYRLSLSGVGMNDTVLTLEDIKTKFPKVEVTTVIQCNGNRREDFHYIDGNTPAFGPPHWVAGAIGNATWAGARMRDVFRYCGMDVDGFSLNKVPVPKEATMVGMTGYDHDEVGNQYCCSFPFEKSIDPYGDVILAYEMNGVDIPRSHGYPIRAIVPGTLILQISRLVFSLM